MCAQCREEVLEADLIGDEEECLLRDHLMAVHPKTVQPETRSVLCGHFLVIERPPPAAYRRPQGGPQPLDLAQEFGVCGSTRPRSAPPRRPTRDTDLRET